MRDLFLESEAAEPVQANRDPALRAGLSAEGGQALAVGNVNALPGGKKIEGMLLLGVRGLI